MLKRSPIADELDPAPRILRLIASATVHAADDCDSADVKKFAATLSRRFIRTAIILEGDRVMRRQDRRRNVWEDMAFAERRQKVRRYRAQLEEIVPATAPKKQVPMTSLEKAQLAEFDARAAAAGGTA